MKRIALTGIICLLAGLLLGYGFRGNDEQSSKGISLARQHVEEAAITGQRVSTPRPPPREPSKAPEPEALITSLREQVARLTLENRSLQARITGASTTPPIETTKIVIPERLIPNLSLEAMGEGYAVGQDVIEVLEITEAEKKQMENALLEARARLDEMEIKHSTVVSQSAAAVELSIPPFEREGEVVRNKLVGDIRTILGEERSGYFIRFARHAIEERFNYFGKATQDVTVTKEDNGNLRVETRSRIETPHGTRSSVQTQSSAELTIPENYRHLFDGQ